MYVCMYIHTFHHGGTDLLIEWAAVRFGLLGYYLGTEGLGCVYVCMYVCVCVWTHPWAAGGLLRSQATFTLHA